MGKTVVGDGVDRLDVSAGAAVTEGSVEAAGAPPTFPIRLAAVDVGSNAIRFLAVEFTDPSHHVILDEQRLPVRLGRSAFVSGALSAESIEATATAFVAFRRSLDVLGIRRYRAVATSAVRESVNGPELIERVRTESGIHLQTISGSEEARLVWLAVHARLVDPPEEWMLMDLGGGSFEVSLATSEGIRWSESHEIGTVRLLAELGDADARPKRFRRLIEEYVSGLRFREVLDRRPALVAITGGNAETIAALAAAPPDAAGVSTISRKALARVVDQLGDMTVQERVEKLGLRADRADVIFPAALIFDRALALAGVSEFTVPFVGVRHGVLLDLLDDELAHSVHVTRVEDQILRAALAIGRRFRFDEAHGAHVARLALSLFDQLQELHGLGVEHRRELLAASVLHDVGQFISHRRHHKHSMYIILNSELPNLSVPEIRNVALVARYHRRANPSPEHELYGELNGEGRRVVRRLSALLRLADPLDREHGQHVKRVSVRLEGTDARLAIDGTGDLLLEHWALARKSSLFEEEFGLKLRTETQEPSTRL